MTWISKDEADASTRVPRPDAVELDGEIRCGIAAMFQAGDNGDGATVAAITASLAPRVGVLSPEEQLELRAVICEHEGRRRYPDAGPLYLLGWSDFDLRQPLFRVVIERAPE